MRTIKELLELMLDNKQYFSNAFGLCNWTNQLLYGNVINWEESDILLLFIKKNRVTPTLSIQDWWYKSKSLYYWKSEKLTPRIHWIKYQIKQLK